MSHFAVMVIGSNVEEQLAPYDENIEVPEYRRSDVTEEDKQEMLQYFNSKRADEEEYSSYNFGKETPPFRMGRNCQFPL